VYKILVQWEGADFEVVVVNFMTVFLAEGCCLLLVKGCDLIALTLCKQKHPLKLSAYINRTAVMLNQGCGREASSRMGSETILGLHSCEQVKREYEKDNKEVYFC